MFFPGCFRSEREKEQRKACFHFSKQILFRQPSSICSLIIHLKAADQKPCIHPAFWPVLSPVLFSWWTKLEAVLCPDCTSFHFISIESQNRKYPPVKTAHGNLLSTKRCYKGLISFYLDPFLCNVACISAWSVKIIFCVIKYLYLRGFVRIESLHYYYFNRDML